MRKGSEVILKQHYLRKGSGCILAYEDLDGGLLQIQ